MSGGERVFAEDDLLPISALQHLLFCERQCALIHVEGLWAENDLTVEGGHLHRRVHIGPDESRPGVRITRSLPLRSFRLGLVGQADVVEFCQPDRGGEGAQDPDVADSCEPFPVEYKRGRPKSHNADEVQLCAQALCLEEMLGVEVPTGALFYGRNRRRTDVAFDAALRSLTERSARRLHELTQSGHTPRVARQPKCDRCSLLDLCLPDATGENSSIDGYMARTLDRVLGE